MYPSLRPRSYLGTRNRTAVAELIGGRRSAGSLIRIYGWYKRIGAKNLYLRYLLDSLPKRDHLFKVTI